MFTQRKKLGGGSNYEQSLGCEPWVAVGGDVGS